MSTQEIFVHLSSKKPAAIRSLFTNDLGPFDQARVVDEQRAALAAGDVFGFMKTLGRQATEGAQPAVAKFAKQSMRIVFHHGQAVSGGNPANHIHLATHPGIMDRDNGLGPGRNEIFELLLVQIQRVRPDVGKNNFCPAQGKSIRRGHESKGGDNHFVAGLDIEQQGAHLKCVRA